MQLLVLRLPRTCTLWVFFLQLDAGADGACVAGTCSVDGELRAQQVRPHTLHHVSGLMATT
ncbi:hypothetical protein PF003_g37558 [Phytophthora fragariae]|nr:hypothetical protein PF003_g37558 [Phytophthora fragariae]